MSLHATDSKDVVHDPIDEKSSGVQTDIEAVYEKEPDDIVEFDEKKELKYVPFVMAQDVHDHVSDHGTSVGVVWSNGTSR